MIKKLKRIAIFNVENMWTNMLSDIKLRAQKFEKQKNDNTPWEDFHLYLACCKSLGVTPSISKFINARAVRR